MYPNELAYADAIKFKVLSTWLKNRLEIKGLKAVSGEEIEELLISLGIEINCSCGCSEVK